MGAVGIIGVGSGGGNRASGGDGCGDAIATAQWWYERAVRSERIAAGLLAVALGGCGSCSGDVVPFRLDSGRPAPAAAAAPPGRAPLAVLPVAVGATRADVEGATLDLGAEPLRAIAAYDVDGDGDRDAIAIAGGDPARAPRVLVSLRDGARLGPASDLGTLPPLLDGCTIGRAGLRALAENRLLADVELACPPDETGAGRVLGAIVIAAVDRPRALERFALRAREREGAADRMAARTEDRDHDGHEDIVLDLALLAEHGDPADVSLSFLDRPAGLARDPAEPEARIAALANEARGPLRRHPERALAGASRALALWEALCREAGAPRIEIAGQPGIVCARSAGAGRALAVLAQAAARTGDPLAATAALGRLSSGAVTVRDADRTAAAAAVDALASTAGEMREGPVATAPAEPAPRRSALAFLDEDRLLVRGSAARVVSLGTGAESPAPESEAGLAIVDASGAHRVVAVERRCEGTVLVLGPADPLAEATGARRTTALVAARRPPAGAPCPDLTPALRADDDGWAVLGWAPQGVLVARALDLVLVPLDVEARAAGAPVVLAASDPVPAPIAPGQATRDARAWARTTPAGLVLSRLAPERSATFLRPTGWTAPEGTAIDVALSPSASRLAWIAAGHVRWIELPGH